MSLSLVYNEKLEGKFMSTIFELDSYTLERISKEALAEVAYENMVTVDFIYERIKDGDLEHMQEYCDIINRKIKEEKEEHE